MLQTSLHVLWIVLDSSCFVVALTACFYFQYCKRYRNTSEDSSKWLYHTWRAVFMAAAYACSALSTQSCTRAVLVLATFVTNGRLQRVLEKIDVPVMLPIVAVYSALACCLHVVHVRVIVLAGASLVHPSPLLHGAAGVLFGILFACDCVVMYAQIRKQRFSLTIEDKKTNEENVFTYSHDSASIYSQVTFLWLRKLLSFSYRNHLEFDHLGSLPDRETAAVNFQRFQAIYRKETHFSKNGKVSVLNLWCCYARASCPNFLLGGLLKLLGDAVGLVAPLGIAVIVDYAASIHDTEKSVTELRLTNSTSCPEYSVFEFGNCTSSDSGHRDKDQWRLNQFFSNGYVMALVVLMTSLMQAVFSQTSSHLVCVEGIRLRCALQALMYDKCLRIASWAGTGGTGVVGKAEPRGDSTKDGGGPLASLIGDDVCNVMSCVWIAHYTWAIPLKICIILYLLYIKLGISAIVGSTCCIITMTPLQFYIGKNMSANAKRIAERADRRLMKVAEVLQGIKLIKLYGWESLFEEKITSLRESELKLLNKDSCYWVLITFLTQLSVVVATATSFCLQLEWGEALSAATVFSGLALFNQLAVPLLMLPVLVPVLISAVVSTRRIVDFLNLPEVPHNHISHEVHHHKKLRRRPNVEHNVDENSSPCDDVTYDIEDEADGLNADSAQLGDDFYDTPGSVDSDDEADDCGPILVSIRNAVFKWGEDSDDAATLQIDYLDIPKGKFIVVVGASGSGKSSLLAALLGEMKLVKGTVTWSRDGVRSAFAAQRPWLQGGSLRSNVAWQHCGRVWRPRRYMRVLRACALVPDIQLLPDSDSTCLGRGGVLLSGGQRARVSVARALYARAPLLLLDEPLGALDKGTARRVLRAVRTLASSSTRVVATAASIIAMEDCKVYAAGTLVEIERSHADLASAWRGAAHGSPQGSRSRTGRERWQLLRLVNRIGHQFGDQHGGWTHDDGSPLLHHRASRVSESLEVAMATEWSSWGGRGTNATETRAVRGPRLRASKAVSLQPRSVPPTPASRHLSSPPITTFSDRSINYPEHAPVNVRPSFIRRLLSITAATRLERTQRTQAAEQKALVVRRVDEPPYAEQQREESLLLTPVHQPKLKSCHSTIAQQTQKHFTQTVEGGSEATPAGLALSNKNTSSDPLVSSFEKPWTGAATYVRACGRAACWACVACAVGAQAARTLADYWIDEAATRARDDAEMWRWLARYMCACSLGAALAAVCACAAACAGSRARRSLHAQLTHRALRLPVRFFDVAPLGDTLNRFSIDIAVIDKKVWAVSLRALQLALVCVCAVVLNVVAAPAALVAFVPAALLYRAVHLAYARLARELQRLDALSHNPIVSQYADTLAGLRTLRAFAQQPRARRMLARNLDVNSHAFLLLNAANRWLGISLDFLGAGILFASTVGALLTARALPGLVPPALLGLVVNATLLVPVYLHWLVKFLAELDAHASAVERVSRFSQLPAHDRQCLCQAGAPVALNNARADIVLEHVSARYGNSAPMLHDVSLTIPAGQKVAICGRSGSGKSTLLLCCVRGGGVEVFSGNVRVAGTISTCSSRSACSGIALVPQDATLFRGTLRENLDPASAHDDTTLWHSLDVVNLKEFVASQPGGLDCLVSAGGGADGGGWSSARASLVCCARGVLCARTALLLDEPAAALGAREERQLLDALAVHADATGITLVTVAHRVSATLGLQRAVVMAAGRLVEDGVPALLARDSQSRFAAVLRAPLY